MLCFVSAVEFQGVGALLPLCGDNTGKVMIIEITFMVLALPAVKVFYPFRIEFSPSFDAW